MPVPGVPVAGEDVLLGGVLVDDPAAGDQPAEPLRVRERVPGPDRPAATPAWTHNTGLDMNQSINPTTNNQSLNSSANYQFGIN